mmetsp:Transcript_1450/g.3139  ORF Transcript_1450/g.3139 Transcript_1450/m.3139 type:complete len:232 (+) Transcript_1450:129-824(+)
MPSSTSGDLAGTTATGSPPSEPHPSLGGDAVAPVVPSPLPGIDPVTSLQDSIDALSLSLFEALRTVRDATVSVPSDSPGPASSAAEEGASSESDSEGAGGAAGCAARRRRRGGGRGDLRETEGLALSIRRASDAVGAAMVEIPGMDRTRSEQLRTIAALIEEDREVGQAIDEAYAASEAKREEVREAVRGAWGMGVLGVEAWESGGEEEDEEEEEDGGSEAIEEDRRVLVQ